MATLTLKNVPDDLYERLKQRAARHRRSLNQEVIAVLEAVEQPESDPAKIALTSRERMAQEGVRLTAGEIEGSTQEGRRPADGDTPALLRRLDAFHASLEAAGFHATAEEIDAWINEGRD
jgi:antitoxin FitA